MTVPISANSNTSSTMTKHAVKFSVKVTFVKARMRDFNRAQDSRTGSNAFECLDGNHGVNEERRCL